MARNRPWNITFCALLAAASLLLVGSVDEESARRRHRIEEMTPSQKADLARKQEHFSNLPREKQERLRELHRRLEADPEGAVLRDVLWRYCDWLATLPPYARNEVEKLPLDRRVENIKQRRYMSQDARAVREWGKAHFKKLGLTPRELFRDFMTQAQQNHAHDPREARRPPKEPEKSDSSRKRWERAESMLVKVFRLENADLSALGDRLSPTTRDKFMRLSPEKQRRWVAGKLVEVADVTARRPRTSPEVVSDEQLAEFFKSESLSDEQREQLMRLPGEEMHEQLLQMYRGEKSPGFPRGGPGRRGMRWEPPFGPFPHHGGPGREPPMPPPEREDDLGPGEPPGPDPGMPPEDRPKQPRKNRSHSQPRETSVQKDGD